MIRHPPRLYKRPKDLGQTRTYWWHDGWIAPELRLYAPDQERTPSDDEDERPVLPSHSTRVVTTVTPRRELDAAEGAPTNGPADGGAGSPDARPQAPDGGAIPRGWTNPGKRVKWTPQLKALFREALAAAGANGGRESPTRILDFMNRRANTGLTRVNVASYLQKYRKAQERLEQRRAASDHYRMYATEHQRAIELAEAERLFANPRLVAPQPHYPPPLTKQQHAVLAPGPMGVPYMSPGGMPGIGAGFGGASGASGFGRGVGVAGAVDWYGGAVDWYVGDARAGDGRIRDGDGAASGDRAQARAGLRHPRGHVAGTEPRDGRGEAECGARRGEAGGEDVGDDSASHGGGGAGASRARRRGAGREGAGREDDHAGGEGGAAGSGRWELGGFGGHRVGAQPQRSAMTLAATHETCNNETIERHRINSSTATDRINGYCASLGRSQSLGTCTATPPDDLNTLTRSSP